MTLFGHKAAACAGAIAKVIAEAGGHSDLLPPNILEEWLEFFAEGIFSVILSTFVTVSKDTSSFGTSDLMVKSLGQALIHIPDEQLFEHSLEANLVVADVDFRSIYPDKLVFLLNHLAPLIVSENRAAQITAYHLLNR